jgi:hypothetical protein
MPRPKRAITPNRGKKPSEIEKVIEKEMEIQVQSMRTSDLVSMSLWSLQNVQKNGESTFNKSLFDQKNNIKKMCQKLAQAARENNAPPPQFYVSILLIPDWKVPGNSYDNPIYNKTKEEFFQNIEKEFASLIKELADEGITLSTEDFYKDGKLTDDEKKFMHQLDANGSSADIIKTKAILNNPNCRHLQIDTNTIVKDYQSFYDKTFGLPEDQQSDAVNANQYAPAHVSANNKIVYLSPNGIIAPVLENRYYEYMKNNFDKKEDKVRGTNAIYDDIFAPALADVGITYANLEVAKHKYYYPANMSRPEYRITSDIVTAINMSWSTQKGVALTIEILKKISPVSYKDADYDSASFNYLIKKYTGHLPRCIKGTENPAAYYENFLNISDMQTDMTVLKQFYLEVFSNDSEKLKQALAKVIPAEDLTAALDDPKTIPNLQKSLAKAFPDTAKGNILTQSLFGRSVLQLQENPTDVNLTKSDISTKDIKEKLVTADKSTIHNLIKREFGFLAQKMSDKAIDFIESTNLKDLGISQYVAMMDFVIAIESGINVKKYISHMKVLPLELQNELLKDAKWILEHSNNIIDHFNYLPNREKSLLYVTQSISNPDTRRQPVIKSFGKAAMSEEIKRKAEFYEKFGKENVSPNTEVTPSTGAPSTTRKNK